MKKQIFELKIQLEGVTKPPIWRKLQIESSSDLSILHLAIQGAMGWLNSHLHHFISGRVFYSIPFPDGFDDNILDERNYKIADVLHQVKDKIMYEYDFGDSWIHSVVLEKIEEVDSNVPYPILISGKGMCPPEDCGGIWGYEELKTVLANPKHPEYAGMVEWLNIEEDEIFDPKYFDLAYQKDYLKEMLEIGDSMAGRAFFS